MTTPTAANGTASMITRVALASSLIVSSTIWTTVPIGIGSRGVCTLITRINVAVHSDLTYSFRNVTMNAKPDVPPVSTASAEAGPTVSTHQTNRSISMMRWSTRFITYAMLLPMRIDRHSLVDQFPIGNKSLLRSG